ncbi:MAG: 16S rRNA (guanine(527)-N(7))-methyltransferase RsmG [Acidobacteria bacterium]|mgnify:CR=1 FL=1|nr:16S rRNA (guanine(527)-N(7))-methyltransferase RsmG [Acidobacteriota bacterium]
MSTSALFVDTILREMRGVLPIPDALVAGLISHYELLLRWNPRMNLTTVTKPEEAAVRHYCESLFLAAHIGEGSVADIGSGPGFPGIPVALVDRSRRVDLVEAHQRKAVFLREAARDLPNVEVLSTRAEVVRGSYDWVVSRAVDPREVLRLRIGSRFALLLGSEDADVAGADRTIPLPWGARRVLVLGAFSRSSG